MDKETLTTRAAAVGRIYGTIAAIVLIVGALAVIAGFIQAIALADDVWTGILAGLVVGLSIGVSVIVAWAGVQMFALVARYIEWRTGREF
ncbi:hypothetical protein [Microbacterium hominis]|uniref:Uncharacterized protein n=1 Tax=Microbacterium hominis TaxID=162426 RepID=A0A7D4U6D2_9MICO|nr:hypothetical protein [Microbacterium hominis]QKJ18306.1 hypothetical protein HQM25_02080 [Microbacterium hominis]